MKKPSPVQAAPSVVASVPPVMTVQEAADVARVSRGFLYRAITRGDLATIKRGKRRLVLGCDLAAYLGIGSEVAA